MVRITLAIPEEQRFRLKVVIMNQRRKYRSRMTQDEYCAKAIGAQLDMDEGAANPWTQLAQWVAFIKECLQGGALAEGWVPKAQALLARNCERCR